MTLCILDCSVAMSWCFADEATAESDALLEKISQQGAWVPNLWHLEVGNVLLQATKRGRITLSDRTAMLHLLRKLPLETDSQTCKQAFRESLNLAQHYQLSLYDAAYLELAIRKNLPLATYDKALISAGTNAGLPLI